MKNVDSVDFMMKFPGENWIVFKTINHSTVHLQFSIGTYK